MGRVNAKLRPPLIPGLAFEALFDSALANFLSTTRNPERGYRQEGFLESRNLTAPEFAFSFLPSLFPLVQSFETNV